jgi:hypothetical protein
MTESEALRAEVDRLIARSFAQEACLLALLSFQVQAGKLPELDVQHLADHLLDHARLSPLTDVQISLIREELSQLLGRLRALNQLDEGFSMEGWDDFPKSPR